MDGEWEPPMIDNPDYKVSWHADYHKINVEPPSKCNDLGVFENLDFFTVYILNNVFCKFQVIPAENDFGISYFPLMLSKIQL